MYFLYLVSQLDAVAHCLKLEQYLACCKLIYGTHEQGSLIKDCNVDEQGTRYNIVLFVKCSVERKCKHVRTIIIFCIFNSHYTILYSVTVLVLSVVSSPVRMNEATTVVTRLNASSRIQTPTFLNHNATSPDRLHGLSSNNSNFKSEERSQSLSFIPVVCFIAFAAALLAMSITLCWRFIRVIRRPKYHLTDSVESHASNTVAPDASNTVKSDAANTVAPDASNTVKSDASTHERPLLERPPSSVDRSEIIDETYHYQDIDQYRGGSRAGLGGGPQIHDAETVDDNLQLSTQQ